MIHFLPVSSVSLYYTIVILAMAFITGFFIARLKNAWLKRLFGWTLAVGFMLLLHFLLLSERPGFRMFAIIIVLFQVMKNLCLIEYVRNKLLWRQWLLFSFGWVGMNPDFLFKKKEEKVVGWKRDLLIGTSRIIIGLVLVILIKMTYDLLAESSVFRLFVALLLLSGLSLILHFGILRINTGILRVAGYPVPVLFRQPLRSVSLREFWGRRWNIPFVEMISAVTYKPLRSIIPAQGALLVAFMFSGVLHELAISVSVIDCIGLPMLYFVFQGVAMVVEDRMFIKPPGKLWVLFWLLVPLPLLFHASFMQRIIWPIVNSG